MDHPERGNQTARPMQMPTTTTTDTANHAPVREGPLRRERRREGAGSTKTGTAPGTAMGGTSGVASASSRGTAATGGGIEAGAAFGGGAAVSGGRRSGGELAFGAAPG